MQRHRRVHWNAIAIGVLASMIYHPAAAQAEPIEALEERIREAYAQEMQLAMKAGAAIEDLGGLLTAPGDPFSAQGVLDTKLRANGVADPAQRQQLAQFVVQKYTEYLAAKRVRWRAKTKESILRSLTKFISNFDTQTQFEKRMHVPGILSRLLLNRESYEYTEVIPGGNQIRSVIPLPSDRDYHAAIYEAGEARDAWVKKSLKIAKEIQGAAAESGYRGTLLGLPELLPLLPRTGRGRSGLIPY